MVSDGSTATMSRFRAMLPRVYELKDTLTAPTHPDAYFQNFEEGFEESTSKRDSFLKTKDGLALSTRRPGRT